MSEYSSSYSSSQSVGTQSTKSGSSDNTDNKTINKLPEFLQTNKLRNFFDGTVSYLLYLSFRIAQRLLQ